MTDMLSHEIQLPSLMKMSYQGNVLDFEDSLATLPLLLVYIDSARCASCVMDHLNVYEAVHGLSISTQAFTFFVLFARNNDFSEYYADFAARKGYSFPIVFDLQNEFLTLNPFIPDKKIFHSFLIGLNQHPVVIGDPSSPQIMELIKEYLNIPSYE